MSNCAKCFHSKDNHVEQGVCSGSLTCRCDHFIASELYEFAEEIEKVKLVYKSLIERCQYILEKIPQLRNAGEKSFYKAYIWIWHDFKIRKGTELDTSTWKHLPNQDSVNRAKRFVKHERDDLKTYNKEVLMHQTAIFQALQEMAIEA